MKLLAVIFASLLALPAFAGQVTLPDLGGNGVKKYDGKNEEAWFHKDCKVTIIGSNRNKVISVQIEDTEKTFIYWTYSPTFASSPGFDAWSATASDNMNQFVDEQNPTKSSNVYTNTATGAGGISSAIFRVSETTNQLTSVEFKYHGQPKNHDITCSKLVLRK